MGTSTPSIYDGTVAKTKLWFLTLFIKNIVWFGNEHRCSLIIFYFRLQSSTLSSWATLIEFLALCPLILCWQWFQVRAALKIPTNMRVAMSGNCQLLHCLYGCLLVLVTDVDWNVNYRKSVRCISSATTLNAHIKSHSGKETLIFL